MGAEMRLLELLEAKKHAKKLSKAGRLADKIRRRKVKAKRNRVQGSPQMRQRPELAWGEFPDPGEELGPMVAITKREKDQAVEFSIAAISGGVEMAADGLRGSEAAAMNNCLYDRGGIEELLDAVNEMPQGQKDPARQLFAYVDGEPEGSHYGGRGDGGTVEFVVAIESFDRVKGLQHVKKAAKWFVSKAAKITAEADNDDYNSIGMSEAGVSFDDYAMKPEKMKGGAGEPAARARLKFWIWADSQYEERDPDDEDEDW